MTTVGGSEVWHPGESCVTTEGPRELLRPLGVAGGLVDERKDVDDAHVKYEAVEGEPESEGDVRRT